jgi:nucleoside phosphorylase
MSMVGYSTLLDAVPRKERSDQYLVLAGLYVLGADAQPTTVKALRELLTLHLAGKVPQNLSLVLRRCSPFAEPVSKGPPMIWRLTTEGREHVRQRAGLPLQANHSTNGFEYDIAFLCALEHPEFSAIMSALGGPKQWQPVGSPRFPHVYRESTLQTESGRTLKVVGTTATSMGLTAAAIATSHLVFQFRPRLVAMVGIAAGTRDGGKQFGDVLIADPSVDYNSGKVVFINGVRGFQPDPYPIGLNPRLRSILKKYRGQDSLFAGIRARWKGELPTKANHLHIGPLGAADQVIDDAGRILEIQSDWRKLIGVEMETYAVYRACEEAPEPKPRFVSFKAVCDFAAEKTDSWQEYAAFTAAEFAVEFLRLEWDALWPDTST